VSSKGSFYVGNVTQSKEKHAAASSQIFARDEWSILHIVASTGLP
jgi:hypothetical protein